MPKIFSIRIERGSRSSSMPSVVAKCRRSDDPDARQYDLGPLSGSAKGEPAWPPLCLFKALLLAVWYDLSDVKLAEALDDRASFRRFCGFSADEATPERTAFVRFRRHLIARGLDKTLFDAVTGQLRAKAITVKTDAEPSLASRRMWEPMRKQRWSKRSR